MDFESFRNVLSRFADETENFDLDAKKKMFVFNSSGEIFQGQLDIDGDGKVWVKEERDEKSILAEKWIETRIARMDTLARRIKEYLEKFSSNEASRGFVNPRFVEIDDDDASFPERQLNMADFENALSPLGKLGTNTLFLTADAGEGKTTVVERLALKKASEYLEGKSSWFVVPVELRARSLDKYDEVIVATLFQQLKFKNLFYEAFIEMIKMGVIVLALDGAEEMFVQRATGDEAVSELGTLLKSLGSKGSVLVSARRAYFSRQAQKVRARLHDSIGESIVNIEQWDLLKWNKDSFLECCRNYGVSDPEGLYGDINAYDSNQNAQHPFLTRAVLATKLIELAKADRDGLKESFSSVSSSEFLGLVTALVKREEMKWVTMTTPPVPLLTKEEHFDLLSMVAEEIWVEGRKGLTDRDLEAVAELYCEQRSKPLAPKRQILKSIGHHALLVRVPSGSGQVTTFEHEDFLSFFVAVALTRQIVVQKRAETIRIFESGSLSDLVLGEVTEYLVKHNLADSAEHFLQDICLTQPETSYSRENSSGLILGLLKYCHSLPIKVQKLVAPKNSLSRMQFKEVHFVDCLFQPTDTRNSIFSNLVFKNCTFESLEIGRESRVEACSFSEDCNIFSISVSDEDDVYYDPSSQQSCLEKYKYVWEENVQKPRKVISVVLDDRIIQLTRAVKVFFRTTEVNEDVLRNKLGKKSPIFFSDVLPVIKDLGIFKEVPFVGGGNHKRYRLAIRMEDLMIQIQESRGNFDVFVDSIRRS